MSETWKNRIKGLILDMDGVLWRGGEAIGDLPAIFNQITALGWRVIFATNNATRTVHQYVEGLSSFGLDAEPSQIVTSAIATISILKKLVPGGGPVYIVGEQGLFEACEENGYYHSENGALAVIAGMDRSLTYKKLQAATLIIRQGVPFIGTNLDPNFPTPQGLIPGAGAILSALSTASGCTPIVAGKPESKMYEVALERLGLTPDQVLAVGDRPETDIAGAQKIGCHTALVLSGVTNRDQAARWRPAPDLIVNDLQSLISLDW